MYCLINKADNTIVEEYGTKPSSLNDLFFPPDISDAALIELGILPVVEVNAQYNEKTQYRSEPSIEVQADKVVYTYTITDIPQSLTTVRADTLADIKKARQSGLNRLTLSAGVSAIYDTNYAAARHIVDGTGTTVMKNGMTAIDYMSGFGRNFNMTAEQFANYIINENLRVGPTAYEIEKRYLALTYAGDIPNGIYPINAMTDINAIKQAAIDYRIFCGLM